METMQQGQVQDSARERREQILHAAMVCFSRRGFHQTTMHDISAEAGISVGLIYRYFENKEAVISAMADEHKRDIQEVLVRAGEAATLREALQIFFTCGCDRVPSHVESAFVLDLFAESTRNPHIAELIGEVREVVIEGLGGLIAKSVEAGVARPGLEPRQAADLVLAVKHGMMFQDVMDRGTEEREARQAEAMGNMWDMLFGEAGPAPAAK